MSNCDGCKGYGIVEEREREILESKERIVWEIEWYFSDWISQVYSLAIYIYI